MDQTAAVRAAIDLLQVPTRVRHVRGEPLPEAMDVLLRIAAGDEDACTLVVEPTGRSPDFLRQAATFYVEQILFAPETDNYRVLGCTPDATSAKLRQHMALLLRWIHPDHQGSGERAVFAQRVTHAWEALKTAERRAAYELTLGPVPAAGTRSSSRRHKAAAAARVQRAEASAHGASRSALSRALMRWLGR